MLRTLLVACLTLPALAQPATPQPDAPPAAQPAEPARQPAAPEAPAEPEPAVELDAARLEGCNMELSLPKGRWKRADVKEATYAQWSRPGGFTLYARLEDFGPNCPDNLDAIQDVLAFTLAQKAESYQDDGAVPFKAAGLEGRRMKATVKDKSGSSRIEIWFGISRGMVYRVAVAGPRARALWLSSDLDKALEHLSILNPALASSNDSRAVASPASFPELGLQLSWPDSLKLQSEPANPRSKAAVFLAEGAWTYVEAFSTHLDGANVLDEDLLRAITYYWQFTPAEPWAKTSLQGGASNWTTRRTESRAARPTVARYRIVRRGDAVIVARAWSILSTGGDQAVSALLDGIDPDALPAAPPAPEALSQEDRFRRGVIFAQAGIARAQAGDNAAAAALYTRAFDLNPADASISNLALDFLSQLGQYREAAALLDRAVPTKDPKALPQWWARAAVIRTEVGDIDGAVQAYESFFATGKRDDKTLTPYLELLQEHDRPQAVLDAIDRFGSGNPDGYAAPRAFALAHLDRADEAVALLKARAAADPEAVWDYLDLLSEIDRYSDVIAECDQRLAGSAHRGGLLYRRGQAEMGLRWFAKAHDSFDAALKALPGNAAVSRALEAAARAMGQGDRSLLAQDLEPVPLPDDLAAAPAAPAAFPDEPVLITLWAHCVSFAPERTMKTTSYSRQRAQTRAALDRLATLEIGFDPALERVQIHTAAVVSPDGARTDADPATFYITDAEAGDASSKKVVVIPIPGLAVGSSVETVITRQRIHPGKTIDFDFYPFDGERPALKRVVRIDAPADAVDWTAYGDLAPAPSGGPLTFIQENRPPFRSEPAAAAFWEDARVLVIGPKTTTWDAVGREYLDTIRTPISAEPPARLAEILAKVDRPDAPLRDRVAALAGFVQRELTYRFIAFGPRAYIPRAPAEPLRERAGDCKDHAVILWSLLNRGGIPAHLALYSTGLPPQINLAHLDAFDHMVVYVPSLDGGAFVDPTGDEADPLYAAHDLNAGTRALVLDPAAPRLVDVPYRAAPDQGLSITREVSVAPDGAASVDETITVRGAPAAFYRERLALPPEERSGWPQRLFSSAAGQAEIKSFDAKDAEDPSKPLVLHAAYTVPACFRDDHGRLAGRIPMAFEEALLRADDPAERRRSVRLGAWSIASVTTLRSQAPDLAPEAPAAPFTRSGDALRTRIDAALADGALTITLSCNDVPGRYPPGAWAVYAKDVRDAAAELARPVRLAPKPAPKPAP